GWVLRGDSPSPRATASAGVERRSGRPLVFPQRMAERRAAHGCRRDERRNTRGFRGGGPRVLGHLRTLAKASPAGYIGRPAPPALALPLHRTDDHAALPSDDFARPCFACLSDHPAPLPWGGGLR